jgi:hypothetical protein
MEFHAVDEPTQPPTEATNESEREFSNTNGEWTGHEFPVPDEARYVFARAVDTEDAATPSEPIELPTAVPEIDEAVTTSQGTLITWTHALVDLDRFEVHAADEAGFQPDDATLVHERVENLRDTSQRVEGLELVGNLTHVRIVAVHDGGNQRLSDTALLADDPAPPIPTNLEATNEDGRVYIAFELASADDLIDLVVEWAPSVDPDASLETARTISLDENPGTREVTIDEDAAAVRLTVTDERGQASVSTTVGVDDATPPNRPEIRASSTDGDTASVHFDHDPPVDLARYEVHALPTRSTQHSDDTLLTRIEEPDDPPLLVSNLTLIDDHPFMQVVAVDTSDNEAASSPKPLDGKDALAKPRNLEVDVVDGGITVAWTATQVGNVEAFRMYAASQTPIALVEDNRLGPSVTPADTDGYELAGLEPDPDDEHVVVAAHGEHGVRLSDPTAITTGGTDDTEEPSPSAEPASTETEHDGSGEVDASREETGTAENDGSVPVWAIMAGLVVAGAAGLVVGLGIKSD